MDINSFDFIAFYLIQGAIWILLIYNLALYFMAKRKFNFSYAAYLLFVSLNFINVKFQIFSMVFPEVSPEDYRFKFETYYVESFMYISYFFFIRHYIESKENYPRIDRLLKIMTLNSTIEIVITNILLSTGHYDILYAIVHGLKIVNMLCAIGLVPLFYMQYNKLIKYLFFGGTSLLIGTVLYFVTFNLGWETDYWSPYYFIYLGILIEVVIFSLGIGYRFKLIQEEKIEAQKALIVNLISRESYEQDVNRRMSITLRKREAEIEQNVEDIYKAKLARELAESKMKLLTSRMNPHFIFNSLNSLKDLVIKRSDALPFIDKFSSLLRSILVQSDTSEITLEEEIATLDQYLSLENLRFGNSIRYTIDISSDIIPGHIFLPPLLIQPIVENALLHGLLPKKSKEKRLLISFSIDREYLVVVVDDNGVGRALSPNKRRKHKSLGLDLIIKRIAYYDEENETNSSLNIVDKHNNEGGSDGTRVIIRLELLV